MAQASTRVGLVGYGQIGRAVHQMIEKDPNNGMSVVFVHDQMSDAINSLPTDLVLEDLGDFASKAPDLVVEMAHPQVTRDWGRKFLENTNYMLISVTALADPEIESMLESTTKEFGTRVFIPHGGVVGSGFTWAWPQTQFSDMDMDTNHKHADGHRQQRHK